MPHRNLQIATNPPARRVVLLVLDGLRADLVGDQRFPNLIALRNASPTLRARQRAGVAGRSIAGTSGTTLRTQRRTGAMALTAWPRRQSQRDQPLRTNFAQPTLFHSPRRSARRSGCTASHTAPAVQVHRAPR